MMVPMNVPMPRVMPSVMMFPASSTTSGRRVMFREVASAEPMK